MKKYLYFVILLVSIFFVSADCYAKDNPKLKSRQMDLKLKRAELQEAAMARLEKGTDKEQTITELLGRLKEEAGKLENTLTETELSEIRCQKEKEELKRKLGSGTPYQGNPVQDSKINELERSMSELKNSLAAKEREVNSKDEENARLKKGVDSAYELIDGLLKDIGQSSQARRSY